MWNEAQKWESDWWGDCISTEFGEEVKQIEYAKLMGLEFFHDGKSSFNIDCHNKSIVDIGGGPCSLLLKTRNASRKVVVEPMDLPSWVLERYKTAGIEVIEQKGEDIQLEGFDEAWIYNVLAHTEDPEKIIKNAKKAARVVRIFEWIDIPVCPGHPQSLTKEKLDSWLGITGNTQILSDREKCLTGRCYYGISEQFPVHFVFTGGTFGYQYYLAVISASKVHDNVTLYILEEPDSDYFRALKGKVRIQKVEIDETLPVLNSELYEPNTTEQMRKNWKNVLKAELLSIDILYKEGGIIKGLDSFTISDYSNHLPMDKEMLVPYWGPDKRSVINDGVIVRKGSKAFEKIYEESIRAIHGKELSGPNKAWEDGKHKWGGVWMTPFVNYMLSAGDEVEFYDNRKHAITWFGSSNPIFSKITEEFVHTDNSTEYMGVKVGPCIRSVLTKQEYDPLKKIKGASVKHPDHYRFHYLGLVHLPAARRYGLCAFSGKIWKLSKMLTDLGHEVYVYGCEGGDAPCTEYIVTHSLKDVVEEWGDKPPNPNFEIGYDYTKEQFRHDMNAPMTKTRAKFNANATKEINARKRDDDFLLLSMGVYQKSVADAVNLFLTCEPGIGYRGSYTRFRSFESAYIQNFTYGSEHPRESINGDYYSRVIPNYFLEEDFPFSPQPKDYFAYVGRMILRKGVWTAVKATEEIGAKLILAGQPDPEIDISKLPNHCEYIGVVDQEERAKLLGGAIATFVPTIYLEPFASVHAESMAVGTPVITTSFGVFGGDTFVDGVHGFKCNTLDDFVFAAKNAHKLDRYEVRKQGEKFFTKNVQWQFQRWFDDLYQLYLSAKYPGMKGWSHIRDSEPSWREHIYKQI